MKYEGVFKLHKNSEGISSFDEVSRFESILFADLSRRFGTARGTNIETKVEGGCNKFSIEFPENREDSVKEALDYINEHFYEIKYDVAGDKDE